MFNLFTGAYGSLIKFSIVVIIVLGMYSGYKYQIHTSYQRGVTAAEIEHKSQILAQNEVLNLKKKSAEKELEQKLTKTKEENDAKIKNLNLRVGTLLGSLSNRPERPSTSSSNPSTTTTTSSVGATGAELYRGDSEFLTRQSARAEEIRLGLLACYKDYDAVKQSIESFTAK